MPEGNGRYIACQSQLECYGSLVDGGVSKELDVFRSEIIESAVAKAVGEVHPACLQRIHTEYGSRLQILVLAGEGVNELRHRLVGFVKIDYGIQRIRIACADIIDNPCLLAVAFVRLKLIGGRGVEITVLIQFLFQHLYAHFGANIAYKNRLRN